MSTVRWLWHELVRPRGRSRHRFYRGGRSTRRGIALLMVIAAIMMLTVLVTEITHGAIVRLQLAGQHRDEAKAHALALTGVQLYRLILMASKKVGNHPLIAQAGPMLGINADSLWQIIPILDSRLMRMIFVSNGELDEDDLAEAKLAGGLTEETVDESREQVSQLKRNFLDFDGDFSAHIQDENRRMYVGKLTGATMADVAKTPAVQELLAMMSEEDSRQFLNDNRLVKEELIGNLVDWTDPDDQRIYGGGSEAALYERLDEPYKPKNAPFDTRDEIRLVEGWHLDGVFERWGRNLTIYGSGRVNINTCHEPVMKGILMAYAETFNEAWVDTVLAELMRLRGTPMAEGGVHFGSAQSFRTFVSQTLGLPLRQDVELAVTTQSDVFRIVSAGEVGNARTELHVIIDFSQDPTGRIMYWGAQ